MSGGSRRRYLVLVASCVALSLAGCTGESTPATPDSVATSASTPEASVGTTNNAQPKTSSSPTTIRYGDSDSQFAELSLPSNGRSPLAVVVLIHGGFWQSAYGFDLMEPVATDLNRRGYATWNIEYRRVGEVGGGYPGTLDDVASSIDKLKDISDDYGLDLSTVTLVGHSSGGHLALWAAGRKDLPEGAPGASPLVVPGLAIGLGPVFDLRAGDADGLGSGAVTNFLAGTYEQFPDRYAIATPSKDSSVDRIVVRATEDDIVPSRYTGPTPLGSIKAVDVPGDHFALIDPSSQAWQTVVALIGG